MPASELVNIAKKNEEILNKSGQQFVKKLQDQFDLLNLNDTQKAKKSISYSVKNGILNIEGLLRIVVLITGRKPGKFPPMSKIQGWVSRKLGITDEAENKKVSFLIARKISEKGTDIFTGKAKGLQLQLIVDEINEELFKEVSNEIALNISNTIYEAYN